MQITKEEAIEFLNEKVFKMTETGKIIFSTLAPKSLENKSYLAVNILGGKLVVLEPAVRKETKSEVIGIRAVYMTGKWFNYNYNQCCLLEIEDVKEFGKRVDNSYFKHLSLSLTLKYTDKPCKFLVVKLGDGNLTGFFLN